MNACSTATALMQRLRLVSGALVLLLSCSQSAWAAPVVVSVEHRVTVTYSKIQFDARKGIYTTQVRIGNDSPAALLSPLRLAFDQKALGDLRLVNEGGTGKDGLSYFEFALPKGGLGAGSRTRPVKVVFFTGKGGRRGEGLKATGKRGETALRAALAAASSVSAGVELAPLSPRAEPYALRAGEGKVKVRFSVILAGKAAPSATVYLRRKGERKGIAMNDLGMEGDLVARDGIHGASVLVDTSGLKPDSCLSYEAYTSVGRSELVSPPFKLCASSLPVRIAVSDASRPVVLPDGTKAVADEILVTAIPNTKSDAMRRLAADVGAKVTGGIPPLDLYQLKLPAPVGADRLSELVSRLNGRPEVRAASVNAIGSYAYVPNDPEFVSQHGLQQVRAHDVWDAGAVGNGVTVTILDSGLDKNHPDFGSSPANCQLAENDCGSGNTDTVGHGTWVAGVIGARTGNALGVAGIAYGSKIHSILVGGGTAPTVAQMTQGFADATAYGIAPVINASFAVLTSTFTNVTSLCSAVNSAVLNGATPVAVVINAAGNGNSNGYYYPGRCNVNEPAATPHAGQNEALTRKDLLVTVANSVSMQTPDCLLNGTGAQDPIDARCEGNVAAGIGGSNYGGWVDIAAPGSAIRTTAVGGGYASPTGTSFSAPLVAGAAAILRACNIQPDQIESVLRTGALVNVPFPDGTSAPRLDVYQALWQRSAPTWAGPSGYSVNENIDTAGGYEVGTLATANAISCDRYTFSIVGGDTGKFGISGAGNDRLILTDGVLDYETRPGHAYAVVVRVTDSFGRSFDQPLTVNLNDLNEAPSIADQVFSINESSPNGTPVGTVLAADQDIGDILTYTITGANPGGFYFAPGGVLTVGNSAALDYEGVVAHSYVLNVQVTDSGGLSSSALVTVNLNNVNEAPSIANQTFTINEKSANGTPLGTVLASDPDVGDSLSYNIIAGNTGGAFSIDGSGGLHVANSAAVDYETTPVFNLTVQVTDAGGLSSTAAITVVLNNVNEAPSIADQTFDHIEYWSGTPFDPEVGIVLASDPDAGDVLTYTITGGNDAVVAGGVLESNAFAFDAAIPGRLVVNNANALNFEYKPVFHLTVQVTDQGGLTATAVVTVNLTNDAADNGDPHINTVDRLHYDFQSAGEFVALRGAGGTEIQLRQTPVSTASALTDGYSGLTSGVSVNTAVAARVGSHRITFQPSISGNPATSGLELRVDGVLTPLPANGLDLGSGGRVASSLGGGIQIDFPNRTKMTATPGWWAPHGLWYLNVQVFHTTAREGIMGARAKGSWLPKLADGTALGPMPAALHDRYVDLYVRFADSWRVDDKSSLFDYAKDTSTRTFTLSEWPKEGGGYTALQGPVAKPAKREVAQRLCRDIEGKNDRADCLFDVMVTGYDGFARTHLLSQKIGTGLTSIVVRDDKDPTRPQEPVTFTATVTRNATVRQTAVRGKGVPTGTVQFSLDGEPDGEPVRLDAKGHAKWMVPRLKPGKYRVSARYIPAKGSVFLPSSSPAEPHWVTEDVMRQTDRQTRQ